MKTMTEHWKCMYYPYYVIIIVKWVMMLNKRTFRISIHRENIFHNTTILIWWKDDRPTVRPAKRTSERTNRKKTIYLLFWNKRMNSREDEKKLINNACTTHHQQTPLWEDYSSMSTHPLTGPTDTYFISIWNTTKRICVHGWCSTQYCNLKGCFLVIRIIHPLVVPVIRFVGWQVYCLVNY